MWVLDVINPLTSTVTTTYYLIAGEWSMGRKKCHFNFKDDVSISRTHSLICVGALSQEQLKDTTTRPTLKIIDQNSRFGSFVNLEQFHGERELKNGDHITFGAKRTVLRVRYQLFILVASRIPRASRNHVNETCQSLGMHLIGSERKDATHCIMHPGRIVATAKVLWALVYNQPVVTTRWIDAIIARTVHSAPLPKCEDFLPMDESMPTVTSNCLPNPMRRTLFHRHVVVFLVHQSMEEIITAMEGIAIAAYKDPAHDDLLLRGIEQHASTRQVLIVEPIQSTGFSSGVSDTKDINPTSTSVERRVELFRSIGATFTTTQALAMSVIFAKAPTASNECSFSSSLAGVDATPVQVMSFPEHLSLRPPPQQDVDSDDKTRGLIMREQETASAQTYAVEPETSSRVEIDETPIPAPPSVPNNLRCTAAKVLASDDIVNESIQVKGEFTPSMPHVSSFDQDVTVKDESACDLHSPTVVVHSSQPSDISQRYLSYAPKGKPPVLTEDEPTSPDCVPTIVPSTDDWVRVRKNSAKTSVGQCDEQCQPLVVSCNLVVKNRDVSRRPVVSDDGSVVNFKRFKKGNGYSERSVTSLFPRSTVVSVNIENTNRHSFNQNLESLQEQERIAEELFAMVEHRKTKKRL